VAVTVVDANGLRGYALAAVTCTVATEAYPREEFPADGRTLALYHFNGDLKDASGHGLDLKADGKRAKEKRPFGFSSQPPMWMSQPAGSCLVLDGAEQFKVTIPATVLHDAAGTPLSMEMMLYLQEFAGWGYDGNPVLLGLQNDWDSLLGWKQETWEKAGGPMFSKVIEPARFVKDFPRERWCQVKITWDGKGKAMFFVDGKAWGTIAGPTLKPGLAAPLTFSVGPFKGMVDEVRLRTGKD
jgi:hypothetical protein